MAKQTDIQRLTALLKASPNQKLTRKKITDALAESRGWDSVKIERVLARAMADPSTCIVSARGGIEYFGAENIANPVLYQEVGRVLEKTWGHSRGMKNLKIFQTSNAGRKGMLDWMHPDLVLVGDPKTKSGSHPGPISHSFEIERPGGFHLDSIFQAFVQGKGTHYSWVVLCESDLSSSYSDRVLWAANRVEVGLITYRKPGSYSTWNPLLSAKPRFPSAKEKSDFQAFGLGSLMAPW